jgi:hypothetical protein
MRWHVYVQVLLISLPAKQGTGIHRNSYQPAVNTSNAQQSVYTRLQMHIRFAVTHITIQYTFRDHCWLHCPQHDNAVTTLLHSLNLSNQNQRYSTSISNVLRYSKKQRSVRKFPCLSFLQQQCQDEHAPLTAENQRTGRKTCSIATLSTTKFTLRSNPGPRDETPVTDDVRHAAGCEFIYQIYTYLTVNTACHHYVLKEQCTGSDTVQFPSGVDTAKCQRPVCFISELNVQRGEVRNLQAIQNRLCTI